MLNQIKQIMKDYEARPYGVSRKYAVLLPLVEVEGEIHVLYEIRSQHISQPGETSFPGGRVEEGETYKQAAVRETTEELNIPAENIEVYGELDFIVSQTHVIRCFVGELKQIDPHALQFNEEVESVFTLPLSFLLENEPEYHATKMKTEYPENFPFDLISNGKHFEWDNLHSHIPFYRLEENYLWGYTANLTHRFTELIKQKRKQSS